MNLTFLFIHCFISELCLGQDISLLSYLLQPQSTHYFFVSLPKFLKTFPNLIKIAVFQPSPLLFPFNPQFWYRNIIKEGIDSFCFEKISFTLLLLKGQKPLLYFFCLAQGLTKAEEHVLECFNLIFKTCVLHNELLKLSILALCNFNLPISQSIKTITFIMQS